MADNKQYDAKALSVLEFFAGEDDSTTSSGNLYKVPLYQRYYTWEGKSQVTSLLRDIEESIKDIESSENKSYFLGPTLLMKDMAKEELDIIDGQQRIVTISIIIAYLRCKINDINETNFQKANDDAIRCLFYIGRGSNISDFKINSKCKIRIDFSLPENITDYRSIIVNSSSKVANEDNISKALEIIIKFFNDKDIHELLKYLRYIMHNVYLVSIRTKRGGSNIHKIFETLNNRGKALTQMQLFKNFALSYFHDSPQYISSIEKNLSTIHSNFSFRKNFKNKEPMDIYFLLQSKIRHGHAPKNTSTKWYEFWKDMIIKPKDPVRKNSEQIQEELLSLFRSCDEETSYYRACLLSDDKYWHQYKGRHVKDENGNSKHLFSEFNNMIGILKDFQIIHPVVFMLIKNNAENEDSMPQNLYDCLKVVYICFIRMWVIHGLSKNIAKPESIFTTVANNIYKHTSLLTSQEVLHLFMQGRGDAKGSEYTNLFDNEHFEKELRYIKYTESGDQRSKFLLGVLENGEAIFNKGYLEGSTTLEHVLPQSDVDDNRQYWKDLNITEWYDFKYRLGNFTLLEEEARKLIKKESFEDKREIYKNSKFEMTKNLAKESCWGPDKIKSRQRCMANNITKILSLDFITNSKSENTR